MYIVSFHDDERALSTLTSEKLWNVSVLSMFVKERKDWKHSSLNEERTVCVQFCNFFHIVDKHKLPSHFSRSGRRKWTGFKSWFELCFDVLLEAQLKSCSLVYIGYDLCCYESNSMHVALQKCNWYYWPVVNFTGSLDLQIRILLKKRREKTETTRNVGIWNSLIS